MMSLVTDLEHLGCCCYVGSENRLFRSPTVRSTGYPRCWALKSIAASVPEPCSHSCSQTKTWWSRSIKTSSSCRWGSSDELHWLPNSATLSLELHSSRRHFYPTFLPLFPLTFVWDQTCMSSQHSCWNLITKVVFWEVSQSIFYCYNKILRQILANW